MPAEPEPNGERAVSRRVLDVKDVAAKIKE